MKISKFITLVFVSLAFVTLNIIMNTNANADPVADRKALMKKTVLPNTKLTGGMANGAIEFDAAKAEAAARAIAEVPQKFVKLFPDDSAGDPESEAKDAIWSDMKGFLAASKKLTASANAAAEAAKSGPDAFKPAFLKMTEACKGCHELYRLKKEQ